MKTTKIRSTRFAHRCLTLCAVTVLSVLTATAFLTPYPCQAEDSPRFWVGIGTHMGKSFAGNSNTAVIERISEGGGNALRDEIYWAQVETRKGELKVPAYAQAYVDKCARQGIEPLIVLSYGNPNYDGGSYPLSPEARAGYIRYCQFMVKHFKGKVRLYEIWNEWDMGLGVPRPKSPDGRRFRGSPKEYVALVAAVAPEIRKVDPGVTILAGGHAMFSLHPGTPDLDSKNPWEVMRGWFDEALAAGLIKHCDGLALHTYTKAVEDPETWMEWVGGLQKRYTKDYNDGKPVPFYVTETGWFTHSGAGNNFQRVGDYVARLYLLARTMPEMKGLWYFNLSNDVFGLCNGAGSPRDAYWAWKDITDITAKGKFLGRLETSDPSIWILRFSLPSGEEVWAAWSRSKRGFRDRRYNSPVTGFFEIKLTNKGKDQNPLKVTMTGMGTFTQPWGLRTERYGKDDPKVTVLTLGPRPQLIRGPLAYVEISNIKPTQEPKPAPTKLEDKEGKNQGLGVK